MGTRWLVWVGRDFEGLEAGMLAGFVAAQKRGHSELLRAGARITRQENQSAPPSSSRTSCGSHHFLAEGSLAGVAARGNAIESAREFNAERTSQNGRMHDVILQDVTP